MPLLKCITDARLITFRSAILDRSVNSSSCTPSAKTHLLFLRSNFQTEALRYFSLARPRPAKIQSVDETAKQSQQTRAATQQWLQFAAKLVCLGRAERFAMLSAGRAVLVAAEFVPKVGRPPLPA